LFQQMSHWLRISDRMNKMKQNNSVHSVKDRNRFG
jgi:hypothetical protein